MVPFCGIVPFRWVELFRSPDVGQVPQPAQNVNGIRGTPRSPYQSPWPRQRNRCFALRSPPVPLPAAGSTRGYSSHPWDSPLRGQRKRCSKSFQTILSCLVSPQPAIPGGLTLLSGLRFADFKRGHKPVPDGEVRGRVRLKIAVTFAAGRGRPQGRARPESQT
jgi:hypothetical protein